MNVSDRKWMKEICGNCGKIYGHHLRLLTPVKRTACPLPRPEGSGALKPDEGTNFKPTGKFLEVEAKV